MWFTYSYKIASQIDIIFHFYVYLTKQGTEAAKSNEVKRKSFT